MSPETKAEIRRYLFSSLITFVGAFALYSVTVIDELTLASFQDGTAVAFLFVGVRAGVKAVCELTVVFAKRIMEILHGEEQ